MEAWNYSENIQKKFLERYDYLDKAKLKEAFTKQD